MWSVKNNLVALDLTSKEHQASRNAGENDVDNFKIQRLL